MDEWIEINKDDAHVKRERNKAKQLRKTAHFQELFRKGICFYCKEKFPADELTLDHIVPLSRGGRSTKGNMVVCCRSCNQEKKYLTPVEMLLRELDIPDNDGCDEI
ncbi:MAG: HNH endonuclease [Lentisphaeria bacterium]|nr:HNH endonuclease [Lentisphaeria bacterium]